MSEPVGASRPGLSMQEAAVAMGVSLNTMRRWCLTGRVRSERIPRPQGYAVRVYLDQVPKQEPQVEGAEQEPQVVRPQEPPPSQAQVPADQARADAMAALISASITPALAPLVAQLDAHRQTVERQAETIAALREDRGRVTAERDAALAELEALRAHNAPPDASGSTESSEPTPEPHPDPDPDPAPLPPTPNTTPWWRRWLGAVHG